MDVLVIRSTLLLFLGLCLSGCQMGYFLQSANGQLSLWSSRVPFDDALKDPKISDADKAKIRLTQEAKKFAEDELGLAHSKNYTDFVALGRPSVTYVVSASPKWTLEHHLWHFPFVGSVPYKGFFNEARAKQEEADLQAENLDTYLRGVSAYSTLGYFRDALLSSMTGYTDHDLVNTIIHETVHTTLYIKSSADFNEQLATFFARIGTERFYLAKEGPNSTTLAAIKNEDQDEILFAEFISKEVQSLKEWYGSHHDNEDARIARLKEIQDRFTVELKPQLKTTVYDRFASAKLNNARLMVYKTYLNDLSDFEKLYEKCGKDLKLFMEKCKALKDEENPGQALKKLI